MIRTRRARRGAARAPALVAMALALASIGAAASGCKSRGSSEGTAPAPIASSRPAAVPADHLAPGELVDGPDHALGVPLPRGVQVIASVGKTVYASGEVGVQPLVEYLRARLKNGSLREGENSATFEGVTAPGQDAPPLVVHVARVRELTRVDVHDATPPPPPPTLPDDAARWKRAGLTPTGRLLDPTHLD